MLISKALKKTADNTIEFDKLVKQYEKKAYNVAYRKTHNREDAEDLVQETFLRALRFFDSYDRNVSFETWLYKIMSNVNIDNYRKSYKANNINILSLDQPIDTGEGEVTPEVADYSADPFNLALEEDTKKNVIKALNELKPDFREVLRLADVEGKSYEEISRITNTNIGTVRSRIFRARNEISKKIQD